MAREGPVATKKYQEMDFVAAILFKTSEHAHSQVSKMPCDFLSEKSSNQQLSTTFCCSPRSQSLRNLASKQIHPGILCEWQAWNTRSTPGGTYFHREKVIFLPGSFCLHMKKVQTFLELPAPSSSVCRKHQKISAKGSLKAYHQQLHHLSQANHG